MPGAPSSDVLTPRQLAFIAERRPIDKRGHRGSLHAKFAVADQSKLFVSSANLTDHALTLNIEMGVLVDCGPLPQRAQELVNVLIRENELKRITALS